MLTILFVGYRGAEEVTFRLNMTTLMLGDMLVACRHFFVAVEREKDQRKKERERDRSAADAGSERGRDISCRCHSKATAGY
jgi:hypothetical protein